MRTFAVAYRLLHLRNACGIRVGLAWLISGLLVVNSTRLDAAPPQSEPALEEKLRDGLTDAKRLQTLEMLARQIRTNYERIVTWRGSYRYNDRFRFNGAMPEVQGSTDETPLANPVPNQPKPLNSGELPIGKDAGGGYWQVTRGVVHFAWDKPADSYHAFYESLEPVRSLEVTTGRCIRWPKVGGSIHWTFTPKHYLEFEVDHTAGQLPGYPKVPTVGLYGGRIAYRYSARQYPRKTRVVDTRSFFSNGSFLFWGHLELYINALRGHRTEAERKLAETGVLVFEQPGPQPTYTVVANYYRDGSQLLTTYDGSVGFNAVRWVDLGPDGAMVAEKQIRYRNIDGIFIPEMFSLTHCEEFNGQTRPTEFRTFKLVDCELNKGIPASEFSLEPFKLKYGERMLDGTEKQLYVLDGDGNFVTAEEFVRRAGK